MVQRHFKTREGSMASDVQWSVGLDAIRRIRLALCRGPLDNSSLAAIT